jgi:hypothetical protein
MGIGFSFDLVLYDGAVRGKRRRERERNLSEDDPSLYDDRFMGIR